MYPSAAQSYHTQQIMTASPAQMVAMLFERLVTSLREAVDAIEQGDIERRWRANKRATEIVIHLRATLDMDRGGEIAENLDRLYGFAMRRLRLVDMRNDPEAAKEVIQIFEPIRDSWFELSKSGASMPDPETGRPNDGAGASDRNANHNGQPHAGDASAIGGLNLST